MKKYLSNKFALPLYDKVTGSTINKYFNQYKNLKYKSTEEIEAFQFNKLKKILFYAHKNIPFYKDIDVNVIKSKYDLKLLPILDRENVQSNFSQLINPNLITKSTHRGSSSGSTGKPIQYYIDKNAQSSGKAAMYLGWELGRWKMGDKGMHLWGNPKVINEQWSKPSSKIKDKIFNLYKYPATDITTHNRIDKILDHINKEKYEFIEGYTTAIYLLAKYIEENKIEKPGSLKYIITTAETLQDFQKETIENNLAEIYDNYGCSEIQGIASQCHICGNYHILDPHVIVEYEDIGNNNMQKEIIITDLNNYVMPLIRYRVGDLVEPIATNCQINFSSIKRIIGRTSDIIELPNGGSLVVASFFGEYLLKAIGHKINQYQVVKVDSKNLELHINVNVKLTENEFQQISDYTKSYLANKINFCIKIVDEIPVSQNGKFKLLIDLTKKN